MTTDTLIGQTLGKYKVTEHLGRGGMAEVYKGYRADLDRTVAIKLMHSFLSAEQDFLFRFKREARAMAQMRHPNIVSVYDFDVYGEHTYYLVMEYIGGGTLKEKLTKLAQNGERLPLEHSVRIALEVAEALTYAHGREMVHRDIKPANIMLDERGKAILTDFGIVKLVGGQSMAYTATGALIGTPAYMSPEQALGKPGDARSDLYSLGILLFQMVTGQLPFSADTPLAVVMKHVNDPVPLPVTFNPDVPRGLQQIILKALAKEPEARYQSASQMAAALHAVELSQEPAEAVSEAAVPALDLEEHHTPAASRTSVASTAVADLAATEVMSPPTEVGRTVTAPTPPGVEKKRPPWIYIGGLLILLLGGAGVLFAAGVIPGTRSEPTATVPVIVQQPTDTPTPEPTATTEEPAATPDPFDNPDVVASSVAAIAQTAAALATDTPTVTSTPTRRPTSTPTSTITPSPDMTAMFLASCVDAVELVSTYTYRASTNSAPISVSFPVNWVLKNSGTCPWPAELTWAYREGEDFGYDGSPIPLEKGVASEEEITLDTTLVAPASSGQFNSTWQLLDSEGESFGPPFTFEIFVYVPATPTPRPSPTPEVQATPTVEATQLDWIYSLSNCEYIGIEWRCMMTMTPYGGGGGPYTMWVFDASQPAEYRGPGPFTHFVKARRCSSYIHEVRLQDDATGTSFSRNIFIDPNEQFAGGCVVA